MEGAIDQEKVKRDNHIQNCAYCVLELSHNSNLFYLLRERRLYAYGALNFKDEDKINSERLFWETENKIKSYLNIL